MELGEFLSLCEHSLDKELDSEGRADLTKVYSSSMLQQEFENPLIFGSIIRAYQIGQVRGKIQRTSENLKRDQEYLKSMSPTP